MAPKRTKASRAARESKQEPGNTGKKASTKQSSSTLKELKLSLSRDELLARLKTLAGHLKGMRQDDDTTKIQQFIDQLVQPGFLSHRNVEIRLWVASCLSDVLRVFAPEAPYSTEQCKKIFRLIASTLQFLNKTNDPNFEQYYYLLENMADVKAFVMCLEIDGFDILATLFTTLFENINTTHSMKVHGAMITIMKDVIVNADQLTTEILDIIFRQLLTSSKATKSAKALARNLLKESVEAMQIHARDFFDGLLGFGKSSDSEHGEQVYELIEEISSIDSNILLNVLSLLEGQLRVEDVDIRKQVVSVLAHIFRDQGFNLMSKHRTLWNEFLQRTVDKESSIREIVVRNLATLGKENQSIFEDVLGRLEPMLLDEDSGVRQQSVDAVGALTMINPELANERILVEAIERRLDKKASVRSCAIKMAGDVYNHVMSLQAQKERIGDSRKIYREIPARVIRSFKSQNFEDKILASQVLNESILSIELSPKENALRLVSFFDNMDDRHRSIFSSVLLGKAKMNRKCSEFFESEGSIDVQTFFHDIGGWIGISEKVQKSLGEILGENSKLYSVFGAAFSTTSSAADCLMARKEICEAIDECTNGVKSAVDTLFARCGPFPIDSESLSILLENVSMDDKMSNFKSAALAFTTMYAKVYPEKFADEEVLGLLSSLIVSKEHTDTVMKVILEVHSSADLSHLKKPLMKLATSGTPEDRRLATNALTRIFGVSSKTTLKLFEQLCKQLKSDREDHCSILAALEVIARLDVELFETRQQQIVMDYIVSDLLLVGDPDAVNESEDASEWTELPNEQCELKVAGINILVARLQGFANLDGLDSAQSIDIAKPTINLLLKCCAEKGELAAEDSGATVAVERSRLRLAAGIGLLQLFREPCYTPLLGLEDFRIFAELMQDSCEEVRTQLVDEFCKFVESGRMGVRHVCALVLCAADPVKPIRDKASLYLTKFMKDTRLKISHMKKASNSRTVIPPPEYALMYLLQLLAHHCDYNHEDSFEYLNKEEQLQGVSSMIQYLDFFLKSICTKGSESFGFLKSLADASRTLNDPQSPKSSKALHYLSELVINLILIRARKPGWRLEEVPATPAVPRELLVGGSITVPMVQLLPKAYVDSLSGHKVERPVDGYESDAMGLSSPMRQSPKRKKKTPSKRSTKEAKRAKLTPDKTQQEPTRRNARRSARSLDQSYKEDDRSDIDMEADEEDIEERDSQRKRWLPKISRRSNSGNTSGSTEQFDFSEDEQEMEEGTDERSPAKLSNNRRKSKATQLFKEVTNTSSRRSAATKKHREDSTPLSTTDIDDDVHSIERRESRRAVRKQPISRGNRRSRRALRS